MTNTKITLPKIEECRNFKDYLIEVVEVLSKETGYEFDYLNDILFEMVDDMDTDETFDEVLNRFIGITLEKDW